MIQITKIGEEPVEQVPYLAAGASGKGVVPSRLPIYFGEMANIPDAYDAIIITSDLQGVIESRHGQQVLLGEELPEMVSLLLQIEKPSFPQERVLVLLCGDLYADPWKRGSSGDPSPVWQAFQREFGQPSLNLQGLPEIRECLQQYPPVLVCCGHVHWERSWIELAQGTQVLNTDGKLFVFTRKSG
ncbi:hypothetical protein ACFYU8_11975 [Brevibacillus sp. NPDC003359]|uniref:hypothetical protein n=1 Tax=unclassified Brevibacillus TaxID=2684853 RepID=UPI003689FB57